MNLPVPPHMRPVRSVYIHVPFCVHRCGYCDFALVANRDDLIPGYLSAIGKEISASAPLEIETLYLGGGTPTQLGTSALADLFRVIQSRFTLAEDYEWTVEANPNDLDEEMAEFLLDAGVNRVSLGIQSFLPEKLRALDRQHTLEDAHRALGYAARFGTYSLDMIFAAPGEDLASWSDDLKNASQWRPPHISTYGLTFERGTQFYAALSRNELSPADEGLERSMYLASIDHWKGVGYEHYEVSSFALPGQRSRHNQVYWSGLPFLGFGPGAASYVGSCRRKNHRSTTAYIDRLLAGASVVTEEEVIDADGRAREALVFGLRRLEGINIDDFTRDFGCHPITLGGDPLDQYLERGWLEVSGSRLRLTHCGLLISDSLWPDLLGA